MPPKSKALKYSKNYIRVLDQTDDPHLRSALRTGKEIPGGPPIQQVQDSPFRVVFLIIFTNLAP
ncbi:MAG: hypothetical protein AVO38_09615 [delta proteobacterium ML8_D]|nr:MAG: hypothetical protein AVO38_09615 [delta proteobacterium ML8_D]